MKTIRFERLLAVVIAVPACLLADSDQLPAALINTVDGPVDLCESPCSTPAAWRPLIPKKDTARILHEGDQLRCKGGTLTIYSEDPIKDIYPKPKDFTSDVCKGRNVSFTIPKPKRLAESSNPLGKYGDNYRRAGRSKGGDSMLFVPSDRSVVAPENLVIRWRTRPPLDPFSLILTTNQNTELAHVDKIDAVAGSLESALFRKALESVRDDAALNHDLRITLKVELRADETISFSVLSHAAEDSVNHSIAQLDSGDGVFAYIARASIYSSAEMYDKAAAEYDAALKLAPDSRDLLTAAYEANFRIGNKARARELSEQLEKSEQSALSK